MTCLQPTLFPSSQVDFCPFCNSLVNTPSESPWRPLVFNSLLYTPECSGQFLLYLYHLRCLFLSPPLSSSCSSPALTKQRNCSHLSPSPVYKARLWINNSLEIVDFCSTASSRPHVMTKKTHDADDRWGLCEEPRALNWILERRASPVRIAINGQPLCGSSCLELL